MKKANYYGAGLEGMSHREGLQIHKEAGFDGEEILQFETMAEAEEVARLAQDIGLEIHSVMGGTHWQLPLSSPDEEVRTKGVEDMKNCLKMAGTTGADTVLLVPGVVNEDVSYDTAYEISLKSIAELVPTAEEVNVTICVENVWNKFLLSPLEMRDFIDQLNHPLVQAYFDVGNVLLYGYPHHWIQILGSRIKKVHIKDFDVNTKQFVGLLEGSVDYPRVIKALRDVGYDGYLTAELSSYPQFPQQFLYDTAAQMDCLLNC